MSSVLPPIFQRLPPSAIVVVLCQPLPCARDRIARPARGSGQLSLSVGLCAASIVVLYCHRFTYLHGQRPNDQLSGTHTTTIRPIRLFHSLLTVVRPHLGPLGKPHYITSKHMVRMRDGVELNTIVFRPPNFEKKYDAVLMRTPYGATGLKGEGEYYSKCHSRVTAEGGRWTRLTQR